MTSTNIALDHASLGLYVFPVARNKAPLTLNGYLDATLDPVVITAWWSKFPSANVGFAAGKSGKSVLDIDHGLVDETGLRAWCQRNRISAETYIVRTGSRPDFKVHLYFDGTMQDCNWELDGCSGQVKSTKGYVLAAGSIAEHRSASAAPYEVLAGSFGTFAPLPDVVRNLKSVKPSKGTETEPITENRNIRLTSVAGSMRNLGMTKDELTAALLLYNEQHVQPPLPEEEVERIAGNIARYDVPTPDPVLVMEKVEVADAEDEEECASEARPRYPDEIWEGTAYGEFADLCTADNQIPKKFFSESFRTVVGALVGDKIRCSLDGVIPRCFTILIAPPGKGKGTSNQRVTDFFTSHWESARGTEPPLLWKGAAKSIFMCKGVGAHILNVASAPGLMHGLEPEKLGKGETLNPLHVWEPLPRVITVNEEIRTLFANFALEGTGAGLESALCELFDRTSFSTTATAQRRQASGEVMFSILGGITRDGWDAVFGKASSTESGFLSRINIIGSEGNFPNTAGLEIPNFERLRSSFLPRILSLIETPVYIRPTPAARDLMNDWFAGLDGAAYLRTRLNIHAWRVALHLAWLHRSDYMGEDEVRAGIEAAKYQIKMREFYAPAAGDNPAARCQASIRRAMHARRRMTLKELKNATNAYRTGLGDWEKAFKILVSAGEIRLAETDNKKLVILLKEKD